MIDWTIKTIKKYYITLNLMHLKHYQHYRLFGLGMRSFRCFFKNLKIWQAFKGTWEVIPWPSSRKFKGAFANFSSYCRLSNAIAGTGSSVIRMSDHLNLYAIGQIVWSQAINTLVHKDVFKILSPLTNLCPFQFSI